MNRKPPTSSKTASNGLPKRPRGEVPGPEARESDLRTLPDLLGRGSSRAEKALGSTADEDAWAAITTTVDNLAPTITRTAPILEEPLPLDKDGQDFFAEAQQSDDLKLPQFSSNALPSDFSLKNSVNIISSQSLQWVLRRGQVPECAAVEQVSCGDTCIPDHLRELLLDAPPIIDTETEEDPGEDVQQEFSAALLHYQHPHTDLPTATGKKWLDLVNEKLPFRARTREARSSPSDEPQASGDDHQRIAVARVESWQESFRSLFYAYRHGYVGHFYVILPTTVAFFGRNFASHSGGRIAPTPSAYHHSLSGASAGGDPYALQPGLLQAASSLCAHFSRATTGLREMMSEFGVQYETKDGLTRDPLPCLVVDGERDAQALFNFISAVGPRLSGARDVPRLVCDWPFRLATLVAGVPVNARETRLVGAEEDATRHSVEVMGLFTPLQTARLCVAMQAARRGGFTLFLGTVEHSSRLNVCAEEQGHDGAGAGATPEALGPNVVSRLQIGADGKLSVFIRPAD